ncbi:MULTISPECIES: hypothetical protein [Vagococcus]|nr:MULTISPECIES: hypothetical protein [Vagococcus]
MIKIVTLLFATVLLIIGWYIKQNISKLEMLFSKENKKNLTYFSTSFLILGIIGIIIGLFLATQSVALFYVAIVLTVSGIFSVQLSKKMR